MKRVMNASKKRLGIFQFKSFCVKKKRICDDELSDIYDIDNFVANLKRLLHKYS